MNMKLAIQCGLLLLPLGVAVAAAPPTDAVGDYRVILERNPFGLKAPAAPAPPPVTAPPETPTNFKLSGITALFKPPRAMFVNTANPSKPEYISLPEGEKGGGITVLSNGINFAAGTVRVIIAGEERTLSFEKDGLKPAPGSPIMTAPGGVVPRFGLNPVPSTPGGSVLQTPATAPITTSQTTFNQPVAATGGGIPGPVSVARVPRIPTTGNVTIPIGAAASQTSPPTPPKVVPEEQALRMEIHQKVYEQTPGAFPPLPATDLRTR